MTSLCVVTMERPKTLRVTIEAIRRYAEQPYEVIVVDNGSTGNDACAYLDQLESSCVVIRNDTNLGLSKAANQGLAAGQYDCLIHMDDDALVKQPGWNQTLARFLDVHPEVGTVAPDRGNVGVVRHPAYTEVRWFLGMLWAVRKTIFEAIGGYDEQLLHQQECDLCLRVRMYGYRAAQCPDLPVSNVVHNDPGGTRTAISLAREDMGTVQFHDKWCEYFRGRSCSYGTTPRYLMQHFPIDQDFFARLAESQGMNLRPPERNVDGQRYWICEELRPDMAFTEPHGSDRYEDSKQQIIKQWQKVTGEEYPGYDWGTPPYGLPPRSRS